MSHHIPPSAVLTEPSLNMHAKFDQQLRQVLHNARLQRFDLATLPSLKNHPELSRFRSVKRVLCVPAVIAILFAIPYYCMSYSDCFLNLPTGMTGAFRPPQECAFCEGVTEVDRVQGITSDEFERQYAYNARPVVVSDATENWTAMAVSLFVVTIELADL